MEEKLFDNLIIDCVVITYIRLMHKFFHFFIKHKICILNILCYN